MFNLPGVDTLTLNAQVLAQVFQGQIQSWNDERIARLQAPEIFLPNASIIVFREATTHEAIKHFLSIDLLYGSIKPSHVKIMTAIDTIPYAIGFAGTDAIRTFRDPSFKVAAIVNKAGFAVAPSLKSITTAMFSVASESSPIFSATDGSEAAFEYPLSYHTYGLVRSSFSDCQVAVDTWHFWNYTALDKDAAAVIMSAGVVQVSGKMQSLALNCLQHLSCGTENVFSMIQYQQLESAFFDGFQIYLIS